MKNVKSLLIFNIFLFLSLFLTNSVYATAWDKAQTSKSGIVDMMEVLPEYLQGSSTAENRDFHIKRNERSIGSGAQYYFYFEGGSLTTSLTTNGILRIGNGTITSSSGNIGIGTTTPSTALQVIGTITATGFSGNGAGLTGISSTFNGGTITTGLSVPNIDIGTTTRGSNTLNVIGNEYISGNVGIGTTTPSTVLHVIGTITASALSVPSSVITVPFVNGTITINCANTATLQMFKLTLAGTATIGFSGAGSGSVISLWLLQDATGTRTVQWATATTFFSGGTRPVPSSYPNAKDRLEFECFDGVGYYCTGFSADVK